MIDAYLTTVFMAAFMIIFGVVLPILDKSERFGKFVSMRFAVLVVFLSLSVGVVLDFSHLKDDLRLVIVLGALIIGGVFILIRTWEKAAANGWNLGIRKIEVSKGDAKASVDVGEQKGKI